MPYEGVSFCMGAAHQHTGFLQRFAGEHIQAGRIDFPCFQGLSKSLLIDDFTPGRVEQNRAVFHLAESGAVEKPSGGFRQRAVDGNDIT